MAEQKKIIRVHGHIPCVHKDVVRMIRGKLCYKAEISDNAGTHIIWIEKSKISKIPIRNPKEFNFKNYPYKIVWDWRRKKEKKK